MPCALYVVDKPEIATVYENGLVTAHKEDRERFPVYLGNIHPVDADELHGNLQVLLIGLDKDCNAVAYYIVEQ